MKIIRVILILFLLSYLALCFLIYYFQEKLIFFSEVLSANYKYSFLENFEEVFIQVDEAKLNALHFKIQNPKGVILYFHGNAGSLAGWGGIAMDFIPLGYDVLIYDYRGYGKSTGSIRNERQILEDANVVYNYLQKQYQENKIVLYGRSIGTGIAIYLAKEKNPSKLLLETPYSSLEAVAKYHYPIFPTFLLKYKLQAYKWIGDTKCPIFIFHGTNDNVISIQFSHELVKFINKEYTFFKIENGGHNDLSLFDV